jgi:putative flippase GtrA
MLVKLLYRLFNIGYPIFKKLFPFQVYLYLVTGAINTAINMGLFAMFINILSDNNFAIELATFLSFSITIFTGFWFSRNFAFSQVKTSQTIKSSQFKKYVLVALQGQVNGYLITKSLIFFLSINPIVAYIATAIFMLTLNYFLQKYYSFKASV